MKIAGLFNFFFSRAGPSIEAVCTKEQIDKNNTKLTNDNRPSNLIMIIIKEQIDKNNTKLTNDNRPSNLIMIIIYEWNMKTAI